MSRINIQETCKLKIENMQYNEINDVAVGRRLAEFLQKRFPGRSEVKRNEEFGFPNSTVRLWISGSKIRDEALLKLELLGCNMNWLMTGEGEIYPPSVTEALHEDVGKESLPSRVIHAVPHDTSPMPLYASAAADSTGRRSVVTDAALEGYTALPDGCGCIRIVGNSMEPIARDGQLALLAPEGRSPGNGDLVVVLLKNEKGVLFKRYYEAGRRIKGKPFLVNLVSVNPLLDIPPITIDENDIDDNRVVIGVRFEA